MRIDREICFFWQGSHLSYQLIFRWALHDKYMYTQQWCNRKDTLHDDNNYVHNVHNNRVLGECRPLWGRARVRCVQDYELSRTQTNHWREREDHASLYLCRAWCIHSSPAPVSLHSASPKLFSHAVVVYGAVELPTSFSLGIHSSLLCKLQLRMLSTCARVRDAGITRAYPDTVRTQTQLVLRYNSYPGGTCVVSTDKVAVELTRRGLAHARPD